MLNIAKMKVNIHVNIEEGTILMIFSRVKEEEKKTGHRK